MKKCTKCNIEKTFTEFSRDKRSKSGLQSSCKECQKKYYKENIDNYKKLRTSNKKYKEKQREYYLKHKGEINEYRRNRYQTEEGKAKVKVNNRNRKDLIRSTSDGSITAKRVLELLKEQDYKCAISGVYIKDDYHIDHIIPLAKGGTHTDDNIQLLAPSVNMSKKDKIL